MDKTTTNSENIADALNILEDAAVQKKDELKRVIADKYVHLRSMLIETEKGIARTLVDAKTQAMDTVLHAKELSTAKGIELAKDLDKNVHVNPWPYIGGTAVIGVLLGFILGRNQK